MYMNDCINVYSNIIISINALDIMVTIGVYFEYIKILCKIFIKYNVAISQFYPSYFIILPKIITNEIYEQYIILYISINYLIITNQILIIFI